MRYFFVSFLLVFFSISKPCFAQTYTVYSIFFKKGSWQIDKKYNATLQALALRCASDSCGKIKMYGFADTTGPEDYNDTLSQKRVNEVYNKMLSYAKVDPKLVYKDFMGELGDLYDMHFPSAHLHQRCVDIRVYFYPPKRKQQ